MSVVSPPRPPEGCPIGLSVGMRGTTPRADCGCEPPAPHLSFSCVKKKDGGERKSLIEPAGGGRPTLWLAASAVSLRASTRHRRNKTFCRPASPQVRPLMPMRWQRSACCRPRLVCASPRVAEVGRPTVLGLRCGRRTGRQGGTLCLGRSRRLRPPSPYGIRRRGQQVRERRGFPPHPSANAATFPSRGRLGSPLVLGEDGE